MAPVVVSLNQLCPIARSMSVLGQKWTILLLREALQGKTRFAEFQQIGVPTGTLGARLEALVSAGLMTRRSYRQEDARSREEYVLTDAGRDVLPVLAALADWGTEHLSVDENLSVDFSTGTNPVPVHLGFISADGEEISHRALTVNRTRRARDGSRIG